MFQFLKRKKTCYIDALFEKLPGVSEFPGIILINVETKEVFSNPDTDSDGDLFLPIEADTYLQQLLKENKGKRQLNIHLTEKAVKGIKLAVELQKQYMSKKSVKPHKVII